MAASRRSIRRTVASVVDGRFEGDLAWGNGGVAVALVPGVLCGVGRCGELHLFDRATASLVATTSPLADGSLGIAHGAVVGEHIVFGFNRGGYRLWPRRCRRCRPCDHARPDRRSADPYSLRLWYGTNRRRPVRTSSNSPSSCLLQEGQLLLEDGEPCRVPRRRGHAGGRSV